MAAHKVVSVVPERSRAAPHRPLAIRQTTVRAFTFVRNWETDVSPVKLTQGDASLSQIVSQSPVPVVITSPRARPVDIFARQEEDKEHEASEGDSASTDNDRQQQENLHREPSNKVVDSRVDKAQVAASQPDAVDGNMTSLPDSQHTPTKNSAPPSVATPGRMSVRASLDMPGRMSLVMSEGSSDDASEPIEYPRRKTDVSNSRSNGRSNGRSKRTISKVSIRTPAEPRKRTLSGTRDKVSPHTPKARQENTVTATPDSPVNNVSPNTPKARREGTVLRTPNRPGNNVSQSKPLESTEDTGTGTADSPVDRVFHSTPITTSKQASVSRSLREEEQGSAQKRQKQTHKEDDHIAISSPLQTSGHPSATSMCDTPSHRTESLSFSVGTPGTMPETQFPGAPKSAQVLKKRTVTTTDLEVPTEVKEIQLLVVDSRHRGIADITDLDVFQQLLEEVAMTYKNQCGTKPERRALDCFVMKLQTEVRNTVDLVQEVRLLKSALLKTTRNVNKQREELLHLQSDSTQLAHEVACLEEKLKDDGGRDPDLQDISSFLTDLQALQVKYHTSTTARKKKKYCPNSEDFNHLKNGRALITEWTMRLESPQYLPHLNDMLESWLQGQTSQSQ